ncbi:tyrosine-protein phosphatase non-receptor type 9 [Eurytemora carolleeae]|uniref:tyrosine-protein phosphatase non-receptor type 9 n=1 Tax=Eurytemora carolleeae TaxID=1294199 RepID=UPI000C78175C|nr:tyrosine-protein phosphatase non-receptor type 9 [Eurytemora carolleeae]|eukprot:XP_023344364.1 tyrosine-protein phosphatase non-receptor type 9-like [Eurytemora affinis]
MGDVYNSIVYPPKSKDRPGSVLTVEEEAATRKFLENVNKWRIANSMVELPWASAVKFLMARKFNVERALMLYQQHEIMRIREGLKYFDSSSEPLRKELAQGKFTILPSKDPNGATLALFNLFLHEPGQVSHQTVLQCVVYQLDIALEEIETQRNGLVFIYNMSNSKYSNFDYDLSQKMLTLLKGCYPARLKKVLIVTAPLWFKAPFKVLRLFVREKLRDRVFTVNLTQLLLHVEPSSLPSELGGSLNYSHQTWMKACQTIAEEKGGELLTMTHSTTQSRSPAASSSPIHLPEQELLGISNGLEETLRFDEDCEDDITEPIASCTSVSSQVNGKLSEHVDAVSLVDKITDVPVSIECMVGEESPASLDVFDSVIDEEGMSLDEFVTYVRTTTRNGLFDQYQETNRYTDVLCYDHTRVILSRDDNDGDTDYINANFVDGYKQKNAFISCQGPLPRTYTDMWQMVWEQRVCVIVMTTRTVERGRTKCGQYWPLEPSTVLDCGHYRINCDSIENYQDFILTELTLTNTRTGEKRSVSHFAFSSWPDYGTPESALSMLQFLQCVRERQAEMTAELIGWTGHPLGPPIVVHCSAGIGRTGTFCTLDIAIRKFEDTEKIDIKRTVDCIRGMRAFSIQMPDQYVFCHLAFLEYVLNMGYVEEIDLTGFDEDIQD